MRELLSWHRFDALLRGQLSAADRLRFPLTWLAWQVLAAALFGASLGVFAITSRDVADPRYVISGALKVPLLLLFTSGITIPSLYVFGALRGLRFSARELAAHLMVAHTVLAAVLASLAPVLAFFALTTSSYSFMVVLDVLACTVAGAFGVRVFVRALAEPPESDLVTIQTAAAPAALDGPTDEGMASLDEMIVPTNSPLSKPASAAVAERPIAPPTAWNLLGSWLFLYAFVGVQAGWILRPFIGRPELVFVLFRPKEGGFFGGVWYHLWQVITGG